MHTMRLVNCLSLATTLSVVLAFFSTASTKEIHREETLAGTIVVEDILGSTEGQRLAHPWGLAFLPNGDMVVTERPGRLRIISNGELSRPLAGLPPIADVGQGGLLDVAAHPNFSENRLIYLSHTMPGPGGRGTAVTRAALIQDGSDYRLENVETIFQMNKFTSNGRHFGSRLAFAPDGTLFFTIGDRGNRPSAQDPDDHAGSVLRINDDGSIPEDNPRMSNRGPLAQGIWSIGHRNPQAAAIHPETGELWTVSHGARGGDEVNVPEKGLNYGWPTISYGRHYSGLKIGEGTTAPGLEQPIYYWDPSIAPSGMAFYQGNQFNEWRGNLFVGALRARQLERLTLNGKEVVDREILLSDMQTRIRDVRNGPDGALYLLTDEANGSVLRVSPAN